MTVCGFAGVARISGQLPPGAGSLVERMRGSLEHRGPDGSGQWQDDFVAMGHQRLSILDVSEAGSQPMVSESQRLVIAFNGEIYNFQEIHERLRKSGEASPFGSDTRTLVEAVDRWGVEETLEMVDGMFAFVLYDRQHRELVLCRDRFGEKPLHYGVQNGLLYFASELRAFDVPDGPELLLDRGATIDYFRYGYVPSPKSIYNGFFKVRPAHIIRIDLVQSGVIQGQEHASRRYWEVAQPQESTSASVEELHQALEASVSTRLVSDRPLGAFLSGGIDSSLTCALAAKSVSGSLQTFTIGWANPEYDESEHAQEVASALGTIHHRVDLAASEVARVAADIGLLIDEPLADSSVIATHLVSREARKHFVVALTGDGGDELFAGYNRHHWLIQVDRLRRRFPKGARRIAGSCLESTSSIIGALTRSAPLSKRPRLVSDKARKFSRAVSADDGLLAYEAVVSGNQDVLGSLDLPTDVIQALNSPDRTNMLWGLRAADIETYLHNDVLAKVDRASMAVSLECRTPFLEPTVAGLAMKFSYAELIEGAQGKMPLRKILSELLPGIDFTRPKTGFGLPIEELLRGPLAALTHEMICRFIQRQLPRELADIKWKDNLERFLQGDDSRLFHVWSVLVFELWISARRHEAVWA